ncbi:hypothetical protein D9M68_533970 [compost metagenome]
MRQHRDLRLRVVLHERGDGARQERQCQRGRGRNLHGAALHVSNLLRRLRNPVDPHQRALHFVKQGLRLGGGMQPAPHPLEQRKADCFLQVGNQPCGGWLGDVQHLGGPRDGLAEHHGAKGFQLADLHAPSL